MRHLLPLALALLLSACPQPDDDDTTAADDDDTTAADDDDAVDDDDSGQPESDLSGTIEIVGGGGGRVIIDVLAAREGAEVQRFELEAIATFSLSGLGSGPVGITAWLDLDEDGELDGVWSPTIEPAGGVVVTLSGDLPELGGWLGNAIGLTDDGMMGDETAGDGWWTTTVRLPRGGAFSYKYLVGTVGDGSWDGVETIGDDRVRHAWDLDGDGRIALVDTFGTPGGAVIEP